MEVTVKKPPKRRSKEARALTTHRPQIIPDKRASHLSDEHDALIKELLQKPDWWPENWEW
jgi:hypothetical protein